MSTSHIQAIHHIHPDSVEGMLADVRGHAERHQLSPEERDAFVAHVLALFHLRPRASKHSAQPGRILRFHRGRRD